MPRPASSQVLVEFDSLVTSPDGEYYAARACGRPADDGRWEGWVEFIPVGEDAVDRAVLSTPRETVQPNQADLAYWAAGLSMVYLEGALQRTQETVADTPRAVETVLPPIGPATPSTQPADMAETVPPPRAVLDPFEVYSQGEDVLRQQLHALDVPHLEQVMKVYHFTTSHVTPGMSTRAALESAILDGVRAAAP